MVIAKNYVIEFFKTLKTNGILVGALYDALKKYLAQYDDSTFDQENATIEQRLNDLLPLQRMGKSAKGYDEKKIACLSKNLLQTMEIGNYTIVELLIKIKLIYIHLLNSKSQVTRQNSLFYPEESLPEPLPSIEDEQQEFLNELISAPLDDIDIYLDSTSFKFEHFYTTAALDELRDRLTHPRSSALYDPRDMVGHLHALFTMPLQKKYAPLTTIDLITYIDDQYHSSKTYKYRTLLQKFVNTKPEPNFTFACFYTTLSLQPIFNQEQERKLATLFKIYCLKLLGADGTKCLLPQNIFSKPARQRNRRKWNKENQGCLKQPSYDSSDERPLSRNTQQVEGRSVHFDANTRDNPTSIPSKSSVSSGYSSSGSIPSSGSSQRFRKRQGI